MAEAEDIPKSFKELIDSVQGDSHEKNAASLLQLARLAEAAERYEDMCLAMKTLIELESKHLKEQGEGMENFVLNVEARNMLSVAYKNEVGKVRTAIRYFKQDHPSRAEDLKKVADYIPGLEKELKTSVESILDLLSKYLIDNTAKKYWMDKAAAAKAAHPDKIEKDDNAAKEEPKEKDQKEMMNGGKASEGQERAATLRQLVQELHKRQKHVLLSWMKDTMDDKTSASKEYPMICADQKTGGLKRIQNFCKEHIKVIDACDNVRALQAPSGKSEDHKKYSLELWKRDKPFDQLTQSVETLVFYLKMCGDYKRYLAEMMDDDEGTLRKAAIKYYEDAYATAELILQATHPTRLGLSLNMSVCYYEIANQKKEACELARSAFDLAIQQLDGLSDDNYKDSTLIMQLLRDNLTIWQQKPDERAEDQED